MKDGFINQTAALVLAIFTALTSLYATQCFAQNDSPKSGYLIDAPVPMDGENSRILLGQLRTLAESAPEGQRLTVVIRYQTDQEAGATTAFEDALKVARAFSKPELRSLRIVSYVSGKIVGHSILPILASDSLVIGDDVSIGNATAGETSADETIALTYRAIAARRSLFTPDVITALVDPDTELALVTETGGKEVYAIGEALTKLREDGKVLSEDVLSIPGEPLVLDGKQLRDMRVTLGAVDSVQDAADLLDLAKLNEVDRKKGLDGAVGVLLEITGSISSNRTGRWMSNLQATVEGGDVNTWVVAIDSAGGDFNESATLAGSFAQPEAPVRTVAGLVRGEARGDSALIALACDPLYMEPDATLGGPGSYEISNIELEQYRELIDEISRRTKRPQALIRGLLNRDLKIHRYKNKKTGNIRYATEDGIVEDQDDPELARERWERLEQIDLASGLDTKQAIELGLVDGESSSIEDTSIRVGLTGSPKALTDRGIVRFVEKLGRSQGLAFFLLFVGFITLSAEANAPGISVPGFISMVCFGLYFWMNFLNGTAEWLELILFALGIICIGIEIFVVPGFGVFGIGGIAMTILGVVLMSQTFVLPKNTYQIGVVTRSLWVALGSIIGVIAGFALMRTFFPNLPLFRGLVMEAPDVATVSEAEKLADFGYLQGKTGKTTTKLMPSGKARFDDRIVAVVTEGSAVEKGEPIRVIDIQGNRVVVEAVNS